VLSDDQLSVAFNQMKHVPDAVSWRADDKRTKQNPRSWRYDVSHRWMNRRADRWMVLECCVSSVRGRPSVA